MADPLAPIGTSLVSADFHSSTPPAPADPGRPAVGRDGFGGVPESFDVLLRRARQGLASDLGVGPASVPEPAGPLAGGTSLPPDGLDAADIHAGWSGGGVADADVEVSVGEVPRQDSAAPGSGATLAALAFRAVATIPAVPGRYAQFEAAESATPAHQVSQNFLLRTSREISAALDPSAGGVPLVGNSSRLEEPGLVEPVRALPLPGAPIHAPQFTSAVTAAPTSAPALRAPVSPAPAFSGTPAPGIELRAEVAAPVLRQIAVAPPLGAGAPIDAPASTAGDVRTSPASSAAVAHPSADVRSAGLAATGLAASQAQAAPSVDDGSGMPLTGGSRLASVRTGSDAGKGSSAPPGPEVHVTDGPTRGSATSAPPILAEDHPLQEFRGAARFLQTAPLGPGIELVVGPEPEPGAQELLAFARASGIGADALERLFGPQGPAAPRASGLPVPLPPGTIRPEPVSVTSTGVAPGVPTLAAAGAFAAASAYWPRPEDGSAVRLRAGASPVQTSLPLAGALPDAAAPSVAVSSPVTVAPLATSSVTQPATLPAGPMSLVMASGQPPGYAEMVHRVSQAVASRMVVGLREGNTSLSMRLEPRALGAVEVEMALHEGRLEATLAAPLAATRELLTEGLARLRDTLGQMGMNVAVLTVSDGLGARSDGKPTRQRSGDAAYTRWNAVDGRVEAATSEARPRGGPGGLDVWA